MQLIAEAVHQSKGKASGSKNCRILSYLQKPLVIGLENSVLQGTEALGVQGNQLHRDLRCVVNQESHHLGFPPMSGSSRDAAMATHWCKL